MLYAEKYSLIENVKTKDVNKDISGKKNKIPLITNKTILFDFSLTVKAAPHECVIRTIQSKT